MQTSLWYWASCLIGNIAIATAASGYLAVFFGIHQPPRQGAMITIALLWLVTFVNMVSPRFVGPGGRSAAGRGPDSAAAGGHRRLVHFDPAQFSASNWNVSGKSDFCAVKRITGAGVLGVTGLESASVAAAVVENPERNVPLATVAGVASPHSFIW